MRAYLRDMAVGGKTEDVDDCGTCMVVLAETVANRSLSNTSTQPERTGRIAL